MYANTEIPNSIVQCVEVTRAGNILLCPLSPFPEAELTFPLCFGPAYFPNHNISKLFYFMCVLYMCAMYTCMRLCECTVPVCAGAEKRGDVGCPPRSSSVLLPWGRVSPLTDFDWAGGQQAARIHSSPPRSAGAIGALSHTLLFDMGPGDPNSARALAQWTISPAQVTFFINAAFDDSGICENLRARCTKVDRGAFQWDILGKLCHCHRQEREMYCEHCENTWYGNWHCEPSQSWFR